MKKVNWWALIFAVLLFFLILTASIGAPICCRFFYYLHIEPLGLPKASGKTAQQIMDSYDAVLDYLVLPGQSFSTGAFAHSQEGAAHFADCKFLFDLNGTVLLLSGSGVAAMLVLRKLKKASPFRLGKRSAAFYAALAAIVLPLGLGGLAALDFDRAFVIFHSIFFPGKDNWIFSPGQDPIILILPQEFFRNCAILIGSCVIGFCALIFATEPRRIRKEA